MGNKLYGKMLNIMNYPTLTQSYKGRFPFKICTTSFIYPDMYAPNVSMLGDYVDEIELLFFDSVYEGSLPSGSQINELWALFKHHNLTCNIHLPLDISLGDSNPVKRLRAVDTVRHILQLTASLDASTCTVHFTYEEKSSLKQDIISWQKRLIRSFNDILRENVDPGLFSVENLAAYPFHWVDPVIAETGLHVCLDIGHFLQRGESFVSAFRKYHPITDILHIYGVKDHRDHLSVDLLPQKHLETLARILKDFSGTVSIEVFSFDALRSSLKTFDQLDI